MKMKKKNKAMTKPCGALSRATELTLSVPSER